MRRLCRKRTGNYNRRDDIVLVERVSDKFPRNLGSDQVNLLRVESGAGLRERMLQSRAIKILEY